MLVRKIFDRTRKHRRPSIECFPKPKHFISCITVVYSELLLLMKFQDFIKQLKNLRFAVTKCKETSKLKTENLFLLKKRSFGQNLSSSYSCSDNGRD